MRRRRTWIPAALLALSTMTVPAVTAQAPERSPSFTAGAAELVAWMRAVFITAPVEEGKRKKLVRDLGMLADELHALEGEKRRFTDLLVDPSPDLNQLRQKMGALRDRVWKVESRARAISIELPERGRADLGVIGEKLRAGLDEKAERIDDIYKDVLGLQRAGTGRPDPSALEDDGKRAIALLREAIDHTVTLRRALQRGAR